MPAVRVMVLILCDSCCDILDGKILKNNLFEL